MSITNYIPKLKFNVIKIPQFGRKDDPAEAISDVILKQREEDGEEFIGMVTYTGIQDSLMIFSKSAVHLDKLS